MSARPAITAERWREAKAILAAALDQPTQEQRLEAARQRCGADAELFHEVRSLLDQTTSTIDSFVARAATPLRRELTSIASGHKVGAYAIVRELGRGGMGAVYLAKRADGAFEKEVALKVLKRGTDTDEVLSRFRTERQILARLVHPNIARLLDAGTTEEGLPYFVMDYVEGEPITIYADARRLSIRERLALFRVVCSTVAYAHRNLVIHRDLKPHNILVTRAGEVKLLDFGIAKLFDESNVEVTLTIQRRLTPVYASPEQVNGEPVTTVSDVYSLGVLLYELLTGERPYLLKTTSEQELIRAICEEEPRRPSTALLRNRQSAVGDPKLLRGDLDNIVLKALNKEPQRRYHSVDRLSDDIRRYLEGLPVRARENTASYRVAKFVRRHKFGVAAAATIAALLVAASLITAWQAQEARHEKKLADQRFAQVRKLAHSVLFDYHDQIASLPGSIHVRERLVKDALEYLDQLSRTAGGDLALWRELATAYDKVGQVQGNSYYDNLGDTEGAIRSYRTSLAIRQRWFGSDPTTPALQQELANSYEGLGDMLYTVGQLRDGLSNYQRAQSLRQRAMAAAPDDDSRVAVAQLEIKIGDIKGLESYANLGDIQGALASYEAAQRIIDSMLAAHPHRDTLKVQLADVLKHAGMASDTLGDAASALQMERRAVAVLEQLAAANPGNQDYRTKLQEGNAFLRYALIDNNMVAEALERSRAMVNELKAIAAADSKDVSARRNLSVAYNALGRDLLLAGDSTGALNSHKQALAISEAILAADPGSESNRSDVAFTLQKIGETLAAQSRWSEAATNYRKALESKEHVTAADPSNARAREDLSTISGELGLALAFIGDEKEAMAQLEKGISIARTLSEQQPANARLRADLASRYFELGQTQGHFHHTGDARAALQESLRQWQQLEQAAKLVPANRKHLEDTEQLLASIG